VFDTTFLDKTRNLTDIKKIKFYGCKKNVEYDLEHGDHVFGKLAKSTAGSTGGWVVQSVIMGHHQHDTTGGRYTTRSTERLEFNVSRHAGSTGTDKEKLYLDVLIPEV
jgi:hypothetical protein